MLLQRARAVRLAAFDVDGVLTSGGLTYGAGGEITKTFHTLDGHGLKLLKAAGIEVALITARRSEALAQRAAGLGIAHVFQGIGDKLTALMALLETLQLPSHEAGYMGDDFIDLPALHKVGFAATVPEAPFWVKQSAHYVTRSSGGGGAVREVCALLLHARGIAPATQLEVAA